MLRGDSGPLFLVGLILTTGCRQSGDVCWALCLRYTDQSGEEEEDGESEEQLQHRILTAALEFVPAHGWTAEAIAEGAKVGGGEGGAAGPNKPQVRTTRASCFLPG